MGILQRDTAVRRDGERLVADLHPDWNIWGPNGGYVAAVALRAAGAVAPQDHRPATMSVQYLSVAEFAEVECQVTPVRQGRSAWLMNVALVQKGKTFLQAQVWTTNKTEGPQVLETASPQVPGPETLKTVAEILGPEAGPPKGFWVNLDTKPVAWLPWGEPNPNGGHVQDWYRFVGYEPGDAFLDGCRAVILIDTMIWPAHARSFAGRPPYIAPSLDLTVWFHQTAPEAEWLLADTWADVAQGGLIHGRASVWTPDRRIVATGGSNLLVTPQR